MDLGLAWQPNVLTRLGSHNAQGQRVMSAPSNEHHLNLASLRHGSGGVWSWHMAQNTQRYKDTNIGRCTSMGYCIFI